MAVLDKVTDFLLFLGKLLISGSVGECDVTCSLSSDINSDTDELIKIAEETGRDILLEDNKSSRIQLFSLYILCCMGFLPVFDEN